jgi:transcriptional regulator with XRE-family HTH domain
MGQNQEMSTIASEHDPFPHQDSLGAFVRGLRHARGLTLKQAAQTSGIGRVTLIRWENAAQRPRLPELMTFLTTLGVGAGERRQALALLDTPGAQALVREEVVRVGERLGLGPLPGGGDLLRAIRRRRGLSPEETASRIGVSIRTLRRWERGEAWPPAYHLHALCHTLGAREAEFVALTVGEFSASTSSFDTPLSIGKVSGELERLHYRIQMGEELLVELRYLTLESQAWHLAAQGDAGRDVLRLAFHYHAIDLNSRGYEDAGRKMAERVLELGPGTARPGLAWVHSRTMVAAELLRTAPLGVERIAWDILRPLLDMTKHLHIQAWILSVMADCLLAQGAGEEALALGAEASRLAVRSGFAGERSLRRRDQADRLLRLGRPAEALDCLEELEADTPFFGIDFALSRAETLLRLGDLSGAEDCLRRVYASIETYDLAHMRAPVDRLAARLPA